MNRSLCGRPRTGSSDGLGDNDLLDLLLVRKEPEGELAGPEVLDVQQVCWPAEVMREQPGCADGRNP
jgi:hypothetical protein